jgi:serine protease Do
MKLISAVLFFLLAFACFVSSVPGQQVVDSQVAKMPKVTAADESAELLADLKMRAPKTLDEVKLLEERVQELVEKVRPATVSFLGGTGVVVSKDGYILSVGHVVMQPGRRVRIRFSDGTRATAVTLGVDERYDTGMAKIVSEGDFPYLELGSSADLVRGQWCLAVGFPVSFSRADEPPVRLGRVLSNRGRSVITDCTIMGGDSGGPLIDLDGKVIGINSQVSGSLNGNMHVPVDIFKRDWKSLTQNEVYSKAGKLKPSPENRGFLGIYWSRGDTAAKVGRVMKGSAAEKAGVKEGDQIIQVAGRRTADYGDVVEQLSSYAAGEIITLRVRRSEKEIEIKVTLGKRP